MAKREKKSAGSLPDSPAVETPFVVEMTATAEAVYGDLFREARAAQKSGHPESAHCTTFNMVKEAVSRIIPSDPLSKRFALRGKLSNFFRLRKGRLRICWIVSSQQRRICILYIAETLRKEGAANDPYVLFQNLVDSGRFNEAMRRLNVRLPRLES